MFLSGNTATAQLISLYLCTFPLAVCLARAKRRFLIFAVVSTNKENDQRVETAGQTQLKGRFVTIMEQTQTWLFIHEGMNHPVGRSSLNGSGPICTYSLNTCKNMSFIGIWREKKGGEEETVSGSEVCECAASALVVCECVCHESVCLNSLP